MKSRNREINIFSLSLMDVISGAMGAFLIVMVIQARFRTVEVGIDPEELRPRLDAAMQALANVRASTERTINDRFVAEVRPATRGLTSGETVPEIMALDKALTADLDRIDDGFAHALEGRAEAVDALAAASAGTEKIFKDYNSRSTPQTQGLARSNLVPEIRMLGQALRADIGEIDKSVDITIKTRNAATGALSSAGNGVGTIMKDRVGKKPTTPSLKGDPSIAEIKTFESALRTDMDTIYRELRKGKESVRGTPFVVTSVFGGCSAYSLQIASDETNRSTGKPYPPYTPVPKDRRLYIDGPLQGRHGETSIWYPAITYLNANAIPGRTYKVYVIGFSESCKGTITVMGPGAKTATPVPRARAGIKKTERVGLSWPKDSVELGDGKRSGMFYFGKIAIGKNGRISLALATPGERADELKAIRDRMEGKDRPTKDKDKPKRKTSDKPPPNKKAVLAIFDRLPTPNNMPSCMQMHNLAARAFNDLDIDNPQSKKALNNFLVDCSSKRFETAQGKLKAAMQELLK